MTKIAEGMTTTYALESIETRAPEKKTNEASRIREREERNDLTQCAMRVAWHWTQFNASGIEIVWFEDATFD